MKMMSSIVFYLSTSCLAALSGHMPAVAVNLEAAGSSF
jgi:hypothetical protein